MVLLRFKYAFAYLILTVYIRILYFFSSHTPNLLFFIILSLLLTHVGV